MSWQASTDDIAVLGYNIYKNNGYITSVTNTSYTDSAVTAGNIYSYAVQAYDASNNKSPLSNVVTATIPTVTSSPNGPTTPTNLTVTLSSNNKARLSWSPSTGGSYGVHGYNIYRNSHYLTTVGTTNYWDGPLTPGQTYVYAVQSYDGSNNKSALSNAVTVLVPQTVTVSSYSVGSLTSTTAIINWTTNVATTGYVKYGLSSTSLTSTSYTTSSGTVGSVIISALKPGTRYYYQVVASDSSNRMASSPIDNFTTTTG